MANNYGKRFEQKFKEDFLKLKGVSIDRIYDVQGGYAHISNICDFIGYKFPYIFYAEVKSIKRNTFPLKNLTQYDKLITKKDIFGVISGVVIWYYDHDKVVFVPIDTVEQIKNEDKKSIHIQKDFYRMIDIPSVKKKVYMDSDYSIIFSQQLEKDGNKIKEFYETLL